MRPVAVLSLMALVVALTVAAGAVSGSSLDDEGPAAGLALSLRSERLVISPGEDLPLVIEAANLGDEAITLTLVCDPQSDLRVYDAGGDLVWQKSPDCAEIASYVRLAPGHEHLWRGVWPGTDQSGAPVEHGAYFIYGILHTMPEEAVVGPLTIEVGERAEASATPREQEPEPSETRNHSEPTRAPAQSGERFPITDSEGRQVRPDVAGHPELGDCQNLVVWWDETADEVWGQFVERNWRGESFKISGDHNAVGPAKVAYNHHRRLWLVVWQSRLDDGRSAILGRYVECGGFEGNVFGISDDGTEDQPAVAASGEHFAVVWRRERDAGRHQILGALVAGHDVRHLAEISDVASVAEPAIACEARGDCLVAWTLERDSGKDVIGRYWFPREELVGEGTLEIAVTDRNERYPSIAWNGWFDRHDRAAYAVTWTDDGGEHSTVRARTVYPTDPDKVDSYVVGDGQVVVSQEAMESDHGDVAALGPDFVAVWSTGYEQPAHIAARCLLYDHETRSLSLGEVVWVSDHERPETYPAAASALDPVALTVWQIEWPAGAADIMGRHVAVCGEEPPESEATNTPGHERPTATPAREHPTPTPVYERPTATPGHETPPDQPETGDPFFVVEREGRQVRPDIDGHPEIIDCQNLVVWLDESGRQIWGQFVEPEWRGDAFKISGDHTVVDDPALGRPKVAYNHHRKLWLVVFAYETDAGGSRIGGRYVECGALEGRVFQIGGEIAHDGDQPVVAPHGEHFAVAWRRELDGGQHQIVGAQVKGLDSGQYAEISDNGDVTEPAMDCEGRGDCLVTWTAELDHGTDVHGRYWFPREEYVGERLLEVANDLARESDSAVAWNGWYGEEGKASYLVSWTAHGDLYTQGDDLWSVRARLVYPGSTDRLDGYVVHPDWVEAADGDRINGHSDVAAVGSDWVLVYSTGDDRLETVLAMRLEYKTDTRELWIGSRAIVGEHEAAEIQPAVASALDPLALVAWQLERDADRADILGRHVALPKVMGGRVVLVGSIVGYADAVEAATLKRDGAAGLLMGRTAQRDETRTLLVYVSSVTEADGVFDCELAALHVAEGANVDQTVRIGDIVSMAAEHEPVYERCYLSVGGPGTYIEQATVTRLAVPEALQAKPR